jgi:cell division protein FtsQ
MNRLARRAQATLRRKPQPSWLGPVRRVGLMMGAMFLIGLAADLAWRSAPVQAAVSTARSSLLSAAQREGLVVGEVLTEGATNTDRRTLLRALAQYKDQNILAVDLGEIRDRLSRLPWIREVSVARELPRTIRIRLVEHEPAARWHDGRRQVLVSKTGMVIPVPSTPRFAKLPLLWGKGAPERAKEILAILASEPALLSRLSYAELVRERRWNIHLEGGVAVRLPEQEPEKAWRRLAAQHRQTGLLGRAIRSVDLRHAPWLSLELAEELYRSPKAPGA